MPKRRLICLDIMRAIAIVFIILYHDISEYISDSGALLIINPFLGMFGLGLFFFLSGYALYFVHPSVNTYSDILRFYKRRVLRIYPLYLFALLIFISPDFFESRLGDLDLSNLNILIHFLGLQILFAPYEKPIFTLWFVGEIILFYLIYPFLVRFTQNIKEMLTLSIFIFVLLLIIHIFLKIIEMRFFYHYFVFISGICMSYLRPFYDNNSSRHLCSISAILSLLLLGISFNYKTMIAEVVINVVPASSYAEAFYGFAYVVLAISFSITALLFATLYADSFSERTKFLISSIAVSSYCAYLFHQPIFIGSQFVLSYLQLPIAIKDICFFLIIPVIFIISYYIQMSSDSLCKRIWRSTSKK